MINILIMEDDDDSREYLKRNLEKFSDRIKVFAPKDSFEYIQIPHHIRFNCIVSDSTHFLHHCGRRYPNSELILWSLSLNSPGEIEDLVKEYQNRLVVFCKENYDDHNDALICYLASIPTS